MKTRILTYIATILATGIIFFSFSASAKDNAETEFSKANQLFGERKYSRATELYNNIPDSYGMQSADLYYNLGITYSEMNNLPRAILCFEKAKLLKPLNGDINVALLAARSRAGLSGADEQGGKSVLFYISGILSLVAWAILCGIFIFATLATIVAGLYISDPKKKTAAKYVAIFATVGIFASLTSGTLRHNYIYAKNEAVVIVRDAKIFASPNEQFPSSVIKLKAGTKINIIKVQNGMYCFKMKKGSTAWIAVSDAEVI